MTETPQKTSIFHKKNKTTRHDPAGALKMKRLCRRPCVYIHYEPY